jgi:WD40 repeat protein/cold shock CspA family protein
MQAASLPNPYVGPRAFERRESRFFFGRDEETEILISLVMAHQTSLFFAQSGAGKSSLLRAGLIPQLTRKLRAGRGDRVRLYQRMAVLPILTVGRGVPPRMSRPISNIYIFSALLGLLPDAEPDGLADLSLADALNTVLGEEARRYEAGPVTTPSGKVRPPLIKPDTALLIFDQFEELFTAYPEHWGKREDFFQQVDLALRRDPTLHVLFTMREDSIAELTPYANLLPDNLRYRFRMERLGPEAALQAVRQPAELAGRPYAEGVAEALVDNLRRVQPGRRVAAVDSDMQSRQLGAYVEPVHLQIVCHQLWANLPQGDRILAEHVQEFGDVDQALTDFYENTLERVLARTEVSERRLREWFDTRLITPARTRGLVYRGEEQTEGLPNAAVDILANAYIIRAEVRGNDTWYELAHDRLVEPIMAANYSWKERQQNPLTIAAEAWLASDKNRKQLLKGDQLKQAQAQAEANPDELSQLEKEFIGASVEAARREAARRQRFMLAGAGLLLIVFAVLAASAFFSAAEARRQREAALSAQEAAEALRLADAALDNLEGDDPELGVLLAIQAVRRTYESAHPRVLIEAESALRRSIQETQQMERTLLGHADEIADLAFSPDGRYLVAVSYDGTASVWDAASDEASLLEGHAGRILDVAFGPELADARGTTSGQGTLMATASEDGTAKVWRIESGAASNAPFAQEILTLTGHTGSVFRAVFSPASSYLATASTDGTVKVWAIPASEDGGAASGREPLTLPGHESGVQDVAFSPNPEPILLATAGADGTVKVWEIGPSSAGDVASRQEPLTLPGRHLDAVSRVIFSPDGARLATASADGTAKVWEIESGAAGNVTSGQALFTLIGHTGPVLDVAFSPECRAPPEGPTEGCADYLATASEDETAKVWDAATGEELFTLSDHGDRVTDVAFSPDGGRLATASVDSTAKLWSLDTGGKPLTLSGHSDRVTGLVFSPDGKLLASGSSDNTLHLYVLDVGVLLGLACNSTTRNLAQDEWDTFIKKDAPYQQTCPELPVHSTVILEYVRRGQIEKARELAPEKELAQALLDLGKELASQEGEPKEALRALNQVSEVDPEFASQNTPALARAYNQVCAQGSADHLPKAVRDACEQAVNLAHDTSDVSLNDDICQNGRVEALFDIVLPACERAVALAVETEDAALNFRVCRHSVEVEALADVVLAACERAVDLSGEEGGTSITTYWAGSPNFNRRQAPEDIGAIVVHASATSDLDDVVSWFNNPQAQVSSHYTIDKDGTIVQHVRDEDRAWHAGKSEWKGRPSLNDWSIGIQLVNLNNGVDPYPEEQHQAAAQLVSYLAVKYGIQLEDIVAHYDVSHSGKTDPKGYDMERLRADVAAVLEDGTFATGVEVIDRCADPEQRYIGHVNWFDAEKGYGVIAYEGCPDVLVDYSAIGGEISGSLEVGQVVAFAVESDQQGLYAVDVELMAGWIPVATKSITTPTPSPTITPTPTPSSAPDQVATPATQIGVKYPRLVYVQSVEPQAQTAWRHAMAIISGADGETLEPLVVSGVAPAWSPDGTQIAFFGEEEITSLGDAFAKGSGIWVVDDKGDNPQLLNKSEHVENMAWSPDGTKLAFEIEPLRDVETTHQVVIIDAGDGKEIGRFFGEQPAWNPDSRKLIIREFDGLWLTDLQGNKERQITKEGSDFFPTWSPDGSYLAFTSLERDGDWEVYIMSAADEPGQGQLVQRLTFHPGEDITPVFSPDGREIYYRVHYGADNWAIEAISVDGGEPRVIAREVGPSETWGVVRPAVRW